MSKEIKMLRSDSKWWPDLKRANGDINWIAKDENDGGVVCSMRCDDYGNFPQSPLLINARGMRDLLVKAYNENKLSHTLMSEISELLNDINPQP